MPKRKRCKVIKCVSPQESDMEIGSPKARESESDDEVEVIVLDVENEALVVDHNSVDSNNSSGKTRKLDYKKYFKYEKIEGDKHGKCLTCERNKKTKYIKMKDHNTSGLKKHLRSCHKSLFSQEFGDSNTLPNQRTIKEAFMQQVKFL